MQITYSITSPLDIKEGMRFSFRNRIWTVDNVYSDIDEPEDLDPDNWVIECHQGYDPEEQTSWYFEPDEMEFYKEFDVKDLPVNLPK